MPNEPLNVADELDIMMGAKEAPADPRFEAEPPLAPPAPPPSEDPASPAGEPPAPPVPASGGEPATPPAAPPEPPTAPAAGEPTPPTAPETPPVAPEPPAPEPPPSPAPAEDPEKVALRAQITALQAQISELADRVAGAPAPSPAAAPQTPSPAAPPAPQPPVTQPVQYVADDKEFDAIFQSPAAFNAFLNKVLEQRDTAVVDRATIAAVERAYTGLPSVVNTMTQRQMAFTQLVRDFYAVNEDLKPYSKLAGIIMNDLAAKEPELLVADLLEKTGKEVRHRLGLPEKSAAPNPVQPSPPAPGPASAPRTISPAFVTPPGVRPAPGARLAGLEAEVNELCTS